MPIRPALCSRLARMPRDTRSSLLRNLANGSDFSIMPLPQWVLAHTARVIFAAPETGPCTTFHEPLACQKNLLSVPNVSTGFSARMQRPPDRSFAAIVLDCQGGPPTALCLISLREEGRFVGRAPQALRQGGLARTCVASAHAHDEPQDSPAHHRRGDGGRRGVCLSRVRRAVQDRRRVVCDARGGRGVCQS